MLTCGFRRSTVLTSRLYGVYRDRPGLYQCSSGACRFQLTVTAHTTLHATKLPLNVWMRGLSFVLQSDKGVSFPRLAEVLGVSQVTAWRMGYALRLLVAQSDQFGGRTKSDPDQPPGRGRKGLPRTTKEHPLAMVERPESREPGAPAGRAGAEVVKDLSLNEIGRVMERAADDQDTYLMTDEWKEFTSVGLHFAAHDTVRHSADEYARRPVHANSAESFDNRVRRTVAGVFLHIGPQHADLYFNKMGFRWSQSVGAGQALRRSRKSGASVQVVWSRIAPVPKLSTVLRNAVGRQMRCSRAGGIKILTNIAGLG